MILTGQGHVLALKNTKDLSADTTNYIKYRPDKFWHNPHILCDYKANFARIGNKSSVKNNIYMS